MLTDKNLVIEKPHPIPEIGGTQRIYKFKDGHGLSAVNSPMLRNFPFAWEIAVLKDVDDDGFGELTYDTKLTTDVEVFSTDKEANKFIKKAEKLFNK